jgi:hypothetical protein
MGAISREKALRVFCWFECPHLLLSQEQRLMRILCTIVEAFVLSMLYSWQDFAFGSAITLQLLSNDHTGNVLESFEQLTEKALGGFLTAATLHKDIQHIAVLINGSPEVMLLAANREYHLVHMPFVATARATTSQLIGVSLPECEAPLPNRFRRHDDASLCQKLFNRSEN